jgi:hypothetical protein
MQPKEPSNEPAPNGGARKAYEPGNQQAPLGEGRSVRPEGEPIRANYPGEAPNTNGEANGGARPGYDDQGNPLPGAEGRVNLDDFTRTNDRDNDGQIDRNPVDLAGPGNGTNGGNHDDALQNPNQEQGANDEAVPIDEYEHSGGSGNNARVVPVEEYATGRHDEPRNRGVHEPVGDDTVHAPPEGTRVDADCDDDEEPPPSEHRGSPGYGQPGIGIVVDPVIREGRHGGVPDYEPVGDNIDDLEPPAGHGDPPKGYPGEGTGAPPQVVLQPLIPEQPAARAAEPPPAPPDARTIDVFETAAAPAPAPESPGPAGLVVSLTGESSPVSDNAIPYSPENGPTITGTSGTAQLEYPGTQQAYAQAPAETEGEISPEVAGLVGALRAAVAGPSRAAEGPKEETDDPNLLERIIDRVKDTLFGGDGEPSDRELADHVSSLGPEEVDQLSRLPSLLGAAAAAGEVPTEEADDGDEVDE